jgi:hypothetical protein
MGLANGHRSGAVDERRIVDPGLTGRWRRRYRALTPIPSSRMRRLDREMAWMETYRRMLEASSQIPRAPAG